MHPYFAIDKSSLTYVPYPPKLSLKFSATLAKVPGFAGIGYIGGYAAWLLWSLGGCYGPRSSIYGLKPS